MSYQTGLTDDHTQEISIGAALAREAAVQGDALAVACEGQTLTWKELHRRTNRIARGLEKPA